ncbi:MAG: peptidyl-prolyl cis-trans isomerase [Solirubrobacteraceae bacterium]|nr:peptidyl-prolyl cis-trans isomerase [Solirubrobacteraceae bacterium]
MLRPLRTVLAAGAIAAPAALVLTGCGGLSADAVAKIGGTEITKAQFDQSYQLATYKLNGVAVLSQKDAKLISVKPPYTSCIAEVKKQAPKPEKGQPAIPDSQYKQQCEQLHEQVRDEAISLLLQDEIVKSEAEDRDVKVTKAELDKGYEEWLTAAIGGKKNIAKFEKVVGLKESVLRNQYASEKLGQKLQEAVQKKDGTTTDKDVKEYYEKNKAQYTQPETRNLHVVLTKGEDEAKKAKAELDGGAKFADVAKKYSIDETTKQAGGKLAGVTKGQQEKALENAAFGAKQGEVVGPVKTESGFYVVRVDKVTASKVVPYDEVKELLTQQVKAERTNNAWTNFTKKAIDDWKEKTECRDGYVVAFCKEYEEPKTDTTQVPADPTGAAGADPTGGAAGGGAAGDGGETVTVE